MKLFQKSQCQSCDALIPEDTFFCKKCKRDRLVRIPQYEWILILLVFFGCAGTFGLGQVIGVRPTPIATQTKNTPTTRAPLPPPAPSNTPIHPTITFEPSLTPKPIFTQGPTSSPDYYSGSNSCPGAPRVKVSKNDLVKVVTSNNDRLILRSKPIIDSSTEIKRLNYGAYLKIHDGPVCVKNPSDGKNYWFWEVKDKATETMGWVADGDSRMHYIEKAK